MENKNIRSVLFGVMVLAVLGLTFGFVYKPSHPTQDENIFSLKAPPFVGVAQAEVNEVTSFLDDEAGISGYFLASTNIVIDNDLRSAFRTIEVETTDYIIGSVEVPNYPETEDVHVFVHTDGWIVTYYLNDDPAAKIFDWRGYHSGDGTSINTKLESVGAIVASLAGVPYTGLEFYDFRYPNATHMMLIAEKQDSDLSFTIKIPASFTYYERSWGTFNTDGNDGGWILDGTVIGQVCSHCTGQGFLSAAQLLPDVTHTVEVDDYGGLALLYREQ